MINRRQTLHGACLLAALLPFGLGRAFAAEQAGRVEDMSGEALAELLAKRRPLASGESVFVGDTVMTGEASRIGMMIGKGTTLRLGAMARLTIDRFLLDAGGVVSLKAGPMLLDRPKAAGAQNIQIRGAFGLIAVRGTQLFAGPSRGKMGVLVRRGSVTVTSGGSTVVLNAGEGTDVAEAGARPSAPAPWGQERINEALASVS
ncbi:MAG: FecR family protein [Beijerinckiaceae bacterium]